MTFGLTLDRTIVQVLLDEPLSVALPYFAGLWRYFQLFPIVCLFLAVSMFVKHGLEVCGLLLSKSGTLDIILMKRFEERLPHIL